VAAPRNRCPLVLSCFWFFHALACPIADAACHAFGTRLSTPPGISDFRIPLNVLGKSGERQRLETSVTGTVGLQRDFKGINMSRIMRVFYEFKERSFSVDTLADVLDAYQLRLNSATAHLTLKFSYPMLKRSLRSGLEGYQYYEAAYEGRVDAAGVFRKFIHFDFVYSSACPCSSELSEHAREERKVYAIPHSQRSKARVVVELEPGALLFVEDMQALCEAALQTETQVMVKREDEQAFAELNGARTSAPRTACTTPVKARSGTPQPSACATTRSGTATTTSSR